jgi:hypothetical protein
MGNRKDARYLSYLGKDKAEWTGKSEVNLNKEIRVYSLFNFPAYISADAFKKIDRIDINVKPIKITFDNTYQKPFEQLKNLTCDGYLYLQKCSLYPNHYQIIIKKGEYCVDDLFRDLTTSVVQYRNLLDLTSYIQSNLSHEHDPSFDENWTDDLVGDLIDAQVSSNQKARVAGSTEVYISDDNINEQKLKSKPARREENTAYELETPQGTEELFEETSGRNAVELFQLETQTKSKKRGRPKKPHQSFQTRLMKSLKIRAQILTKTDQHSKVLMN